MPGKRTGEVAWRYQTQPAVARVVDAAAPDADIDPATVEAVAEEIDNRDSAIAFNGVANVFALLPETVTTADIHVFVDISMVEDNGSGDLVAITDDERWLYLANKTVTRTDMIQIENAPIGVYKILVTNTAGTGDIKVGAMLPK